MGATAPRLPAAIRFALDCLAAGIPAADIVRYLLEVGAARALRVAQLPLYDHRRGALVRLRLAISEAMYTGADVLSDRRCIAARAA